MTLRALALAFIASLALTACDEQPSTVDCNASSLCAEAATLAALFDNRAGEEISDLIAFRGARASGATLTIELVVPFPDARIGGADRQTLSSIGYTVIAGAFCGGGRFASFIPRGGQVVQRVYSNDNRILSSSFVNTRPVGGDAPDGGGQRTTG